MSERITFHSSGAHFGDAVANGYDGQYGRVKFVKGWLTGGTDPADGSVECGGGTAFPMLATQKQITEIFYRVKDTIFTGGELTVSTTPPFPIGFKVNAPSSNASNRAVSIDYEPLTRGYTTPETSGAATISAQNLPYLQAAYDAGSGDMYADVDDKERALWLQGESTLTLPYWNYDLADITTAFSFSSLTVATTSTDYFQGLQGDLDFSPTFADVAATIVFSKSIAIVRVNPDDDISAPTNLFYLGVVVDIQIANGAVLINSQESAISGYPVSPCDYVIQLSNSNVSCPLYVDETGYSYVYGSDFVHEAYEWWPYKKKDLASAWITATGLSNGNPTI